MVWRSLRGDLLYRVGDVFISTNSQNPSSYYGGAWQLLCPGRTLVCIDTSQSEFNTVKKTGGEKTHTLTTNEMPSHTHTQYMWLFNGVSVPGGGYKYGVTPKYQEGVLMAVNSLGHDEFGEIGSNYNAKAGNSQSHNNLQPYMAVYMWVRVS